MFNEVLIGEQGEFPQHATAFCEIVHSSLILTWIVIGKREARKKLNGYAS